MNAVITISKFVPIFVAITLSSCPSRKLPRDYMSESASHHPSATASPTPGWIGHLPPRHHGHHAHRRRRRVHVGGRPGGGRRQRRGHPHGLGHLGRRRAVPRHDFHQAPAKGGNTNAGFGDFLGFNSAWGYWISALLCTVSFSALLFGREAAANLPSVIGASILIWFYVFLVSRGIKEATGVNAVITISKFVPIFAITAIIFLQKSRPRHLSGEHVAGRRSGPAVLRPGQQHHDDHHLGVRGHRGRGRDLRSRRRNAMWQGHHHRVHLRAQHLSPW